MNEKKELSFEEALAKLEEIVALLDSGNAPLDKSLALFEEGAGLVKLCSAKLDNVEQRVKILVADKDGEINENDFKPVME